MNLNIRITGPAGAGVNSTVDIVASLFAELGYDLVTDIEYESRIKGGVNFFDVNISDEEKKYLTKKVDIILAFNADSLKAQLYSLKSGATIIVNNKWSEKLKEKGVSLDDFNVLDLEINDKYDNTYLLGILAKYLNLDLEIMLSKLAHVFAKKGEETVKSNQDIVKNIFETYEIKTPSSIKIERVGEAKNMTFGNKAISDGATECGLEFYSAYPMTPASTLLSEIIKAGKVKYLQAEDEIAVINSAIGAAFTGARAMSGTSGGGFALMTEALSFAVQAEFPITVVLAQRAGPSTGTPTYHEAGDLNFALNPTFGDFEHVVLYPSSLEEAYYFGGLALNIADKYQTQVIMLTDKQAAELHGTHTELKAPEIDRGVVLDNPPSDYKRYELTESGVSPRVKVGTKDGDFISTSYEHDEYGATTEDSDMKKAMTEKRWRKLQNFFKKEGYRGYEVYTSPHSISPNGREVAQPKKMLIVTSFTAYTAKEFVKENPEYGLIIVKFLKPLDERLRDELVGKDEVIFVESNYSGQLEKYLTNELGLKYVDGLKISNLRKYDLFPFYIEDFRELIK
ncbi:MAG: 2-oxoacid:acceptor oxidoreductase family protein [Candidatus Gracilibacteria bacterium]|nr:2-oxoacid:acceptor oxidoreductase family protein [Candidatus Gracilibacteria bacterium]